MKFKFCKKLICSFFCLSLLNISVFADRLTNQFQQIIMDGSAEEIKKAIRMTPELLTEKVGIEKKNFLIVALENDRDLKIIKLLMKAGLKPTDKTKLKQNALMIACENSSHPDVVEYLIQKTKFSKGSRKSFIYEKDFDKNDSFDYALGNENPDAIIQVLSKYAPNPFEEEPSPEAENPEDQNSKNENQENGENQDSENEEPQDSENKPDENPSENSNSENENSSPSEEENSENSAKNEATESPVNVADALASSIFDQKSKPETVSSLGASLPQIALPLPDVKPYKRTYLFDDGDLPDLENEIPEDDFEVKNRTFIENANLKDKMGRTPLMHASQKGDIELIKDLIYSGADVHAQDKDGWTALMFACRYQMYPDVVNLLIKNGSVITFKNRHGISALNLAGAFNSNPAVLQALLKNRTISDSEIRGAFVYAIQAEASTSILNVFLSKGIPINMSFDGKTPLMYACESNSNTQIIAWLIENGAKTGFKTADGKTAYDFAQANKKLPRDTIYWSLNQ